MNPTGSLDYWRSYFGRAKGDIFSIIEHAILVAASDCPKEFRHRRDGIAERLFSSGLAARCLGCASKESKVNGGRDGQRGVKVRMVSSYSYGEAEALTDEIEQESQCVEEVFTIRRILLNFEEENRVEWNGGEWNYDGFRYLDTTKLDGVGWSAFHPISSDFSIFLHSQIVGNDMECKLFQTMERNNYVIPLHSSASDSVLFESLRRLQVMELTVDLLQATEIGKAVNPLRKHGSRDIRQLACTLIDGWKEMVDEWVKASTPIAGSEGTPDSVKTFLVDEEEGLPSPPMDEGAFFASQPGSMELSQFFDGMDDDGNPQQSGEFIKNRESGRISSLDSRRKPLASHEPNLIAKDSKSQQAMKNEANVNLNKPVIADSGPDRVPKSTMQTKGNMEPKMQQKIDKSVIPKRPQVNRLDKFKCSDDAAVQVKLEATKRKLQERYQQAENAKRQRTVRVMELHDLPKRGAGRRNPHVKLGNHKQQWAPGRR